MRNTLVFCVALFVATPTVAQNYRSEIDIDVVDMDLAELMDQIGRKVGVNILVDPDVHERVTIALRNVSWKTAVRVIADRTDCNIEAYPGRVVSLKKPTRVSMQYTEANVRTVLMQLANYAGANIILSSEVQGTVTLDIRDVDYMTALRAVVDTVGGGKFTVVGTGRYKVSADPVLAAESAKPKPAPVKTFEGRMISVTDRILKLKSKSGKTVNCRLPEGATARKLLLKTLKQVKEGHRVVISYRKVDKRIVVADLIAQSR